MRVLLGAIAGGALMVVTLEAMSALGVPAEAQNAGDVDCNGSVNSIDASLILQFTAGRLSLLSCPSAADVNDDGSANSIDALFVLQFDAGLISSFPTCDLTASPSNSQVTIDAAGAGDTICLQPGTYNRLFFYRKSNVTLIGAGAANTIVTDEPDKHTCLLVIESQDITIEDVRARDCTVQAAFAGDSTNVVFHRVETVGGPIGFQYQRSTGRIEDSHAHDHDSFGAIVQMSSDVTIDNTTLERADIGVINQDHTTLHLNNSSVLDNPSGGVFTLQQTGHTVVDGTSITGNGLNVFAGVPGCADLPPADPNPPQCYLDNTSAFVSQVQIEIADSTISDSDGPGIVLFPGVTAGLTRTTISNAGLTGLFVWGALLTAAGNDYGNNVENAIECRAYPGPSTGDRGMCDLTNEHIHDSQPLSGNRLGGGFVSEGGEFRLTGSTIEGNWGIGVQVLHGGTGTVANNTVRNNGGTAFCISGAGSVDVHDNSESGNRAGTCMGHP